MNPGVIRTTRTTRTSGRPSTALLLGLCVLLESCALDDSDMRLAPSLSTAADECTVRTYASSAVSGYKKGSTAEPFTGSDLDYFVKQTKVLMNSIAVNEYVKSNRAVAVLGNNQGELLATYLNMFRATRDRSYLERFITEARGTIALRDDYTGLPSTYDQTRSAAAVPAWSTRYYSTDGSYFPFLVESGDLTFPMADFAQLVINGPDCLKTMTYAGRSLLDHARYFRDEVAKTVAFHMEEFQIVHDFGFFFARYPAQSNQYGKAYPINYQLSMGRTLLMLYRATNDPAYLERASQLARFFFNELRWHPSKVDSARPGYYLWQYWPEIPESPSYAHVPIPDLEDIGHLVIEFEFVALANQLGVEPFSHRFSDVLGRLGFTYLEEYVRSESTRYRLPGNVFSLASTDQLNYMRSDGPVLQFAEFNPMTTTLLRLHTYDGLIRYLKLHTDVHSVMARKSMSQFVWYWAQRFKPVLPTDKIR